MKKLSAAVLSAALILTACGSAPAPAANTTDTAPAETTTTTAASFAETTAQTTAASSAKAEDVEILNFIPPAEGEEIAVINIKDYGVIKDDRIRRRSEAVKEEDTGLEMPELKFEHDIKKKGDSDED